MRSATILLVSFFLLQLLSCLGKRGESTEPDAAMELSHGMESCVNLFYEAGNLQKSTHPDEEIKLKCESIIQGGEAMQTNLFRGHETGLRFYDVGGFHGQKELIAYDDSLSFFFSVLVYLSKDRFVKEPIPPVWLENDIQKRESVIKGMISDNGIREYPRVPACYSSFDLAFDENSIIHYLKIKSNGRQITKGFLEAIFSDVVGVLNQIGLNDENNEREVQYRRSSIDTLLDFVSVCTCGESRICCEAERLIYSSFFMNGGNGISPIIYKSNKDDKYIIFNLHEYNSLHTNVYVRSASKFDIITLFENGRAFR